MVELDIVPYRQGLELQTRIFDLVKGSALPGVLLLLQHSPVVTIGKAGGWDNMLVSREDFRSQGIEIYETSRGGNITYHGPGQLVGYPILNLDYWQKDVHWYLRNLEQVIINTLRVFGVEAGRKPKYTGVWVGDRKIAAIGVSVRNWITTHGFALQITTENLHHFNLINPCGITRFGVAALEELVPGVCFGEVAEAVKAGFSEVFACQLTAMDITSIAGDLYGNQASLAGGQGAGPGSPGRNGKPV